MNRRRILLVVAVLVAALGAGLVFLYAQDAEDRAVSDVEMVDVLVATQTIEAGTAAADLGKNGQVVVGQVPADQQLEGSTADGKDFTDTVALTTIYPGEQLLLQRFGTVDEVQGTTTVTFPPKQLAIQLQLEDARRVGSFTQPGSHVAIFVSLPPEGSGPVDGAIDPETGLPVVNGGIPRASVLLEDVLVVGVGTTTLTSPGVDANGDPLSPIPVTNLTIAVTQDEAELVLGAQTYGLTFALRTDASDVEANAPGVEAQSR